jgi:hypothetical protein
MRFGKAALLYLQSDGKATVLIFEMRAKFPNGQQRHRLRGMFS